MKKKKLKYKPKVEFTLIGITTNLEDYSLSWIINNSTSMNLVKSDNFKLDCEKYPDFPEFSVFKGLFSKTGCPVRLVKNKSNEGIHLIDELKNIDYFLILYTQNDYSDFDSLIKSIKDNNDIIAVFNINTDGLKSIDNLLF